MDHNERQIIDELFGKLRQAEQVAGPRDPEAERHIATALAAQPAAAYYMAQAILVQEQTLKALNDKVQELEQTLAERPAAGGGGFLGGLFGSPAQPARPAAAPARGMGAVPPATGRGWSGAPDPAGAYAQPPRAGGGFLASAAQTALGVAGGVVLANALTGLFASEPAAAAPAPEPAPEPAAEPDAGAGDLGMDDPFADAGGFDDTFGEF